MGARLADAEARRLNSHDLSDVLLSGGSAERPAHCPRFSRKTGVQGVATTYKFEGTAFIVSQGDLVIAEKEPRQTFGPNSGTGSKIVQRLHAPIRKYFIYDYASA